MKDIQWREEPIATRHDRKGFDCGEEALNGFLTQYARQAHDSGASKTYVAIDVGDGKTILGFYTLCPTEVPFDDVPHEAQPRKGGRRPIAAIRLARIAVSKNHQKRGIGGALLLAAGRRCIRASEEIGGSMLVIDAKNDKAASWYKEYGAIEITRKPLCLVLPYATLTEALREAGI